ncbi:MAG: RecX family transcriptional regulator [Dehalococcoidales bacterium]|nr:RecX family transcriptional regulator [Dehalococcoidales bacterium]
MGKITTLRGGRNRQKRVNVFLNGKSAFGLEAELAIREGLYVGQELSPGQVEMLVRSDHFHRCLNAATRYLGYRPRSESELRKKLQQRGFDEDDINIVIGKLKEQGLVNDTAFAQFWKDNRESFSPRSQRLTRLELRRKGLANDVIDPVVDVIDDEDSAYRAALSKARSLSQSDYSTFYRRLGEYLKRRGFSYDVIKHTVERIWQERGKVR